MPAPHPPFCIYLSHVPSHPWQHEFPRIEPPDHEVPDSELDRKADGEEDDNQSASRVYRLARFMNPGEFPRLLNQILEAPPYRGKEIELQIFGQHHNFLEVIEVNPNILIGEELSELQVSLLTDKSWMFIFKFGAINLDTKSATIIGLHHRSMKFKLPKRGKVPGYSRETSVMMNRKGGGLRSKPDMYKGRFKMNPADICDYIQAKINMGFPIDIDENVPPMFASDTIDANKARYAELLKLAKEMLEEAENVLPTAPPPPPRMPFDPTYVHPIPPGSAGRLPANFFHPPMQTMQEAAEVDDSDEEEAERPLQRRRVNSGDTGALLPRNAPHSPQRLMHGAPAMRLPRTRTPP